MEPDLTTLVSLARAGDPRAAEALHERFAGAVRAAVRRQLHPRLRPQFDSIDFTQDVWASFFTAPPGGHTFNTADALTGFLAAVARNKVLDAVRSRLNTLKHDLSRHQRLDDGGAAEQLFARLPTGSQRAVADEEWEQLLSRFPAGHRAILERLRDGHTREEIAAAAGLSLRTVDRVIRRLKDLTEG